MLSVLIILLQALHWLPVKCNISEVPTFIEPFGARHELAFGIEFTVDHVISSVALPNGSICGIARISGGAEYQSLMRRYLDISHDTSITQRPPTSLEEWRQAAMQGTTDEEARRARFIRQPESLWDNVAVRILKQPHYSSEVFEGDLYSGDPEVAILASAVEALKHATWLELRTRFNLRSDMAQWPYASIVTPDFLWTTIKPQPEPDINPDGKVTWDTNFDHQSFWFRHLLYKFNTALYRNRFRRFQQSSDWAHLLRTPTMTTGISPASAEVFVHARSHTSARSNLADHVCGTLHTRPTSIVVSFSDAILTLWLEQAEPDWTPWGTFKELGANAMSNRTGALQATPAYWSETLERIATLSENISCPENKTFDLILSGSSWNEEGLKGFNAALESWKLRLKVNDVLDDLDPFAASKVAAASEGWGFDSRDHCYAAFANYGEDITHDEV